MDQDTVLQFLQKISDQLGVAGQEAFRVVMNRVLAEAVIWIIIGTLILLVAGGIGILLIWDGLKTTRSDGGDEAFLGFMIFFIAFLIACVCIIPSAINLLSPEYATIERILNLVGKAR